MVMVSQFSESVLHYSGALLSLTTGSVIRVFLFTPFWRRNLGDPTFQCFPMVYSFQGHLKTFMAGSVTLKQLPLVIDRRVSLPKAEGSAEGDDNRTFGPYRRLSSVVVKTLGQLCMFMPRRNVGTISCKAPLFISNMLLSWPIFSFAYCCKKA